MIWVFGRESERSKEVRSGLVIVFLGKRREVNGVVGIWFDPMWFRFLFFIVIHHVEIHEFPASSKRFHVRG